jgi:hypothetical protein
VPDFVWIQNVVFPLVGMSLGALFLFGVYRTVNRMIDRRHEAKMGIPAGLAAEVEQLRQRLDQLDDQQERLQELEERLDFAERMLAQHTQRPMLGGEH